MIVVCEQCQTRFRLDKSRIPAAGARVRCSRCHHKFLVRPAGAAGAAGGRGGKPQHSAAAASEEEPDLENPEFLLDRPSRKSTPPSPPMPESAPSDSPLHPEEEAGLFASEPTAPPAPTDPATRLDPDSPWGEEPASPDRGDPGGSEGSELELDLPDSRSRQAASLEIPDPPSETDSSTELQLDRPSPREQTSPEPLSEVTIEPAPVKRTAPAPSTPPLPTPRAVAPPPLALGLAALLVGLALALGAARSLARVSLGEAGQTVSLRGSGWRVADAESFHVRDGSGGRVLVVRGRLAAEEPRPLPRVSARLVGSDGRPLGSEVAPVWSWIGDDLLLPDRLRTLARSSGVLEPLPPAGGSGRAAVPFTLLFPEPSARARRISIRLEPSDPSARETY